MPSPRVWGDPRPSDRLREYSRDIGFEMGGRFFPAWLFIEKFLSIRDKQGRKVPFVLNGEQVELYRQACLMRREGKPVRIDVLKARQIGFSTFIAALIFTMCLYVPGQTAAIVADKAEHARNIYEKYRFFHESVEWPQLRLPLVRSNAMELVADHGGGMTSSVRIMVQGASAGRSGTYRFLHLSECAFWPDLKGTLAGLLETVGSDMGTMVFLETTANGFNEYRDRWLADRSGETGYKACFFPWWKHADYRAKPLANPRLLPHEEEARRKYGLDDGQVAFYRERYADAGNDLATLRQEYPSSAEEAFRTAGSGYFDNDAIARRKEEVSSLRPLRRGRWECRALFSPDASQVSLEDPAFVELRNGPLSYYRDPVPGHYYVLSLDPAMGGEDWYAFQVIDTSDLSQCCVWHAKGCDDEDVAWQMCLVAAEYGNCLVSAEANTANGAWILRLCERAGATVFRDGPSGRDGGNAGNDLGFKTKQTNKPMMAGLLKAAFSESPGIVSDYGTLSEMEAFSVRQTAAGNAKLGASGGSHDDLVMSLCGALYTLEQSGWSRIPEQVERELAARARKGRGKARLVDWRRGV